MKTEQQQEKERINRLLFPEQYKRSATESSVDRLRGLRWQDDEGGDLDEGDDARPDGMWPYFNYDGDPDLFLEEIRRIPLRQIFSNIPGIRDLYVNGYANHHANLGRCFVHVAGKSSATRDEVEKVALDDMRSILQKYNLSSHDFEFTVDIELDNGEYTDIDDAVSSLISDITPVANQSKPISISAQARAVFDARSMVRDMGVLKVGADTLSWNVNNVLSYSLEDAVEEQVRTKFGVTDDTFFVCADLNDDPGFQGLLPEIDEIKKKVTDDVISLLRFNFLPAYKSGKLLPKTICVIAVHSDYLVPPARKDSYSAILVFRAEDIQNQISSPDIVYVQGNKPEKIGGWYRWKRASRSKNAGESFSDAQGLQSILSQIGITVRGEEERDDCINESAFDKESRCKSCDIVALSESRAKFTWYTQEEASTGPLKEFIRCLGYVLNQNNYTTPFSVLYIVESRDGPDRGSYRGTIYFDGKTVTEGRRTYGTESVKEDVVGGTASASKFSVGDYVKKGQYTRSDSEDEEAYGGQITAVHEENGVYMYDITAPALYGGDRTIAEKDLEPMKNKFYVGDRVVEQDSGRAKVTAVYIYNFSLTSKDYGKPAYDIRTFDGSNAGGIRERWLKRDR